jgi:hypothetical protein
VAAHRWVEDENGSSVTRLRNLTIEQHKFLFYVDSNHVELNAGGSLLKLVDALARQSRSILTEHVIDMSTFAD